MSCGFRRTGWRAANVNDDLARSSQRIDPSATCVYEYLTLSSYEDYEILLLETMQQLNDQPLLLRPRYPTFTLSNLCSLTSPWPGKQPQAQPLSPGHE